MTGGFLTTSATWEAPKKHILLFPNPAPFFIFCLQPLKKFQENLKRWIGKLRPGERVAGFVQAGAWLRLPFDFAPTNGPFPNSPHPSFPEWCGRSPGHWLHQAGRSGEHARYFLSKVTSVSNPSVPWKQPHDTENRILLCLCLGSSYTPPLQETSSAGPGGENDMHLISDLQMKAGIHQGSHVEEPGGCTRWGPA